LQEDRAHREAGPVLLVVLRCMLRATWRSHGLRAERQQALAILMGWLGDGDQTTKWIADECAVRPTPERAWLHWLSLTTPVTEEEVGSTTAPGLPREEPGPRAARAGSRQEPQWPQPLQPQSPHATRHSATGCRVAHDDGHIPRVRCRRLRRAGVQKGRATTHAVPLLQRQ
jgi:hypothetical protein